MPTVITSTIITQSGNPLTNDYPHGQDGDKSGANHPQTAHGIKDSRLSPFFRYHNTHRTSRPEDRKA